MHTHQVDHHRRAWTAAVTLWIGLAAPAAAQSRLVLPAGSVILVRTTAPLQSASAQNGQSFETTVEQSVGVDEYTIIPAGSRIRGEISVARPATRQQSGVIEVVFNRIVLSDGTSVPITGKLTSTDSAERRQIERDPNARVVLVGERGGIGAAIAGAGQSQSPNNIFAALGSLLSEGRDVNVPAGTPLAVEIEQAVSLRGRGRVSAGDANTLYTAAERIRDAQTALAQRKYYRGAINGQLDDPTRLALFQFQADAGFRATGNLDGRTARALGVNIAGGVTGAALTSDVASSVRRDAQSLVSRLRAELGSSGVGRLNPSRNYSQGDLEAWFALSAFADNASLYEQVVRGGDNANATVFAGRALMGAARRVDAALQSARVSSSLQSAWSSLRGQLSPIDTQG
ncbi:MAG TPA: peptidoglycan-binding protein [Gemmatimonadaceae bacterium]